MKTFRLLADLQFEAYDLPEAFSTARQFLMLAQHNGNERDLCDMGFRGELFLKPIDDAPLPVGTQLKLEF